MTPKAAIIEVEGTSQDAIKLIQMYPAERFYVRIIRSETLMEEHDPRLDILEGIKKRLERMNPKPDNRNWVREGRDGAMWPEWVMDEA